MTTTTASQMKKYLICDVSRSILLQIGNLFGLTAVYDEMLQ